MNAFAMSDELPVIAFLGATMQQPRIPRQRHTDCAAIRQVGNDGVIGYAHTDNAGDITHH